MLRKQVKGKCKDCGADCELIEEIELKVGKKIYYRCPECGGYTSYTE